MPGATQPALRREHWPWGTRGLAIARLDLFGRFCASDKARPDRFFDLEAMPDSSSSALQPPLRIFVVENHPDTLHFLTLFLEELGHTVFSATTMAQALQALPTADCDVLISDIGLPDGNGWELLRSVKLPHPIYAIAMSGFGMNADRLKSKEAGFRHHLLKPFVPDDLDTALAEAAEEVAARA